MFNAQPTGTLTSRRWGGGGRGGGRGGVHWGRRSSSGSDVFHTQEISYRRTTKPCADVLF